MVRPNRKKIEEKKKLLEEGYIECGYCDEPVKPKALKCPHCGKWYSSGKQAIALILTITILLSSVGYYYWSGNHSASNLSSSPYVVSSYPSGTAVTTTSSLSMTFSREMNRTLVESAFSLSPNIPGIFSWSGNTLTFKPSTQLAAGTVYTATIGENAHDINGKKLDCGMYRWVFTTATGTGTITRRDIGNGDNEFWSRAVSHPSWVTTAVQTKPQLILTHSTGCAPCDTMISICGPLSTEYTGQIVYYDITSGTDEPEATDCFGAYDPNGEPHYVPLTTVVTKGPNNTIIWHSWEGVVDEVTLRSWIDDAISYHDEYSG